VAILEQVENLLYIPGQPTLPANLLPPCPRHITLIFPDPDETFLPIVRIMVVDPSAAVRGLSGGKWHTP
jgi:hypothetical protein